MGKGKRAVRGDPASAGGDAGGSAGSARRDRDGAAAPAAEEGKPGAGAAPQKGAGRALLLLFGLPIIAIVLALVLRSGCVG